MTVTLHGDSTRCPNCGGHKTVRSKLCRKCRDKARRTKDGDTISDAKIMLRDASEAAYRREKYGHA